MPAATPNASTIPAAARARYRIARQILIWLPLSRFRQLDELNLVNGQAEFNRRRIWVDVAQVGDLGRRRAEGSTGYPGQGASGSSLAP
jgi:hypothetical protein